MESTGAGKRGALSGGDGGDDAERVLFFSNLLMVLSLQLVPGRGLTVNSSFLARSACKSRT